jgi:2',3'-cyclic-nucleotide 2'-phosphodiesterase / 3'-nucleotidase
MALTRRAFLGSVGTIAGTAVGLAPGITPADAQTPMARIKLRLLETSDLHMFVLDWDYYRVKTDPSVGLAKVASLIRAARAENPNTLLFDNGDYIQGNPLADYVVTQGNATANAPHPIVALFTALGYDAVGLGNHEFNYGLEYLEASFLGAPFPFVCTNVTRVGGAPFLPPTAVLERQVKDETGTSHTLRIGVIGFVPPQIMVWDKARLEGKLECGDIIAAAKRYIPELRAKCDVLVALCHSGIRTGEYVEGQEHAAFHLAAVPGIDVIFTGHSHRLFPGQDFADLAKDLPDPKSVDAVTGRLQGIPAVMPGFWGSHLGVVDLELKRDGSKWVVDSAKVETRPISQRKDGKVESLTTSDAAVTALIAPAHQSTLAWLVHPAGAVDARVHSYFVWAGYDPASAIVNAAQTWYARQLLAGTPYADMPLLSSVAPFRVGYTPDSFIDIAKGPAKLRDVADLYFYSSNTLVALQLTGAQIIEWLETSVRVFNTIDPVNSGPQSLIDKRIPSYSFDIISGITYQIDVTKPARYDAKGTLLPDNRRIANVVMAGQPLDANREFIVLTNNHRADSGGHGGVLTKAKTALRAPDTNRDCVLRYFKAHDPVMVPTTFPWTFAPISRHTQVYFDTSLAARPLAATVPNFTSVGDAEPGYARIQLTLN